MPVNYNGLNCVHLGSLDVCDNWPGFYALFVFLCFCFVPVGTINILQFNYFLLVPFFITSVYEESFL
jgi:hypothetical protein